jgi:hypothetical protein
MGRMMEKKFTLESAIAAIDLMVSEAIKARRLAIEKEDWSRALIQESFRNGLEQAMAIIEMVETK